MAALRAAKPSDANNRFPSSIPESLMQHNAKPPFDTTSRKIEQAALDNAAGGGGGGGGGGDGGGWKTFTICGGGSVTVWAQ